MDKAQIQQIKRALREVWLRSHQRGNAVKAAKVKEHCGFFLNGNKKFKILFTCNVCNRNVSKKDYNIDHISPVHIVGADWQKHIDALFCDTEQLQLLCTECHNLKTQRERK